MAYLHIMESADRELTDTLRAAWPGTFVLNPITVPDPTVPEAPALIEDGARDIVSFGALATPDKA